MSFLIVSLMGGGVAASETNITLNSFSLKHEAGFQKRKINELS